jgi:hypothetical protein
MSNYSSIWGGYKPRPYSKTPNAEAIAYEALGRAAFYFGLWLGIAIGKTLVDFFNR